LLPTEVGNDRKNYPVVDVAAAGGWRDIRTLLTCYQQPDPDTIRAVVERRPIEQKLTHLSHKQNGAGATYTETYTVGWVAR
jgi:hypothetical protein